MALTATYFQLWTGVDNQNGTTFEITGKDFNPSEPTSFFQWSAYRRTNAAPTNLTGYRYWHEIVVAVAERTNNTWAVITAELKIAFLMPWGNVWTYSFGSQTLAAGWWWYTWYSYAGIDYDEFETNWTGTIAMYADTDQLASTNITWSNYDTSWNSKHTGSEWALWIEWANIHYVDWNWYEHLIDNDASYSSFIWTSKSWYMRLDDGGDHRRIYYIDENWYKRRTYLADNWFWWSSSVGVSKKWYMWAPAIEDANYWYTYLCFVWNNWYKYRIMNWPV